MSKILVWDAPVRVFHWLLVLSFAGAWLTSEADGFRLVHVTLGLTVLALVLFRLAWGVVGTRYARFGDFIRPPAAALAYLKGLLRGNAPRYVGHNPAGALAIVLLLLLGLVVPLSGLATLNEWGGDASEELHELLGNGMLLVVGVHVLGVLVGSWRHGEKLVAAMVTGFKQGEPNQAIGRSWWVLGALLLVAVLAFWALQWRSAPQGGLVQPQRVAAAMQEGREGDDEEDEHRADRAQQARSRD